MSFEAGYRVACDEIYHAVEYEDHPEKCGVCRACGVIRTVIEDAASTLCDQMTQEEFLTFAAIVGRGQRAAGRSGLGSVDISPSFPRRRESIDF